MNKDFEELTDMLDDVIGGTSSNGLFTFSLTGDTDQSEENKCS